MDNAGLQSGGRNQKKKRFGDTPQETAKDNIGRKRSAFSPLSIRVTSSGARHSVPPQSARIHLPPAAGLDIDFTASSNSPFPRCDIVRTFDIYTYTVPTDKFR